MFLASSEVIQKTNEAFLWIGGISLVLLVGITVAMLAFVWKYRRKVHPKAEQIEGNTKLEITWIVIPTIIVLFMFWQGYRGFAVMRNVPEGAMEIEVTARKWSWSFHYPEVDVTTSELVVPVNRPVKLLLTAPADDVIHSFYLPDFRVKEDCVPGRVTYLWFQGDAEHLEGSPYPVFCAEYCGTGHSRMYSSVTFKTAEDFKDWLWKEVEKRYRAIDIDIVMDPESTDIKDCDGPGLYQTYCASCHGRNGEGGLVGGARSFQKLEDWRRGYEVPQIWETLEIGLDDLVEDSQMRSFSNLSAWNRFALAWYVASLYPGADRPTGSRESFQKMIEKYGLDEQQAPPRPLDIEATIEAMAEDSK